jgi:hypothetical protein
VTRSWDGVLQQAGLIAVVLAAAFPLAAVSTGRLRDPVEVVGRPLVDGYSERAESAAWFVFLAATAATSFVISRRRWPSSPAASFSIVATVPFAVALWRGSWQGLILYLFVGAAAFGWSARRPPTFGVGFLLWAAAFPWFVWRDATSVGVLLTPTAAAVVVAWLLDRRVEVANALRLSLTAGAGAFIALSTKELVVAAGVGAAASLLGRRCTPFVAPFRQSSWLAASALTSAALLWFELWRPMGDFAPALMIAAGAGWGTMAASVRWPRLPSLQFATRHWAMAAAAVMIVLSREKLWCVAVLSPAFAVAYFGRPHWRKAWLIALLFPLAFLSAGPTPRAFDPFHDGQILSAVREVERGRTIYADVFPLRGYEFYLAWVGREVMPGATFAYSWLESALKFVPLAGAALLTFGWTRSLPWSLLTGLALSIPFAQDGRIGLHFWLGAATLAMLRSGGAATIIAWIVAGLAAAAAGFDLYVPFAAASLVGIAVSRRGAVRAVTTVLGLVVPWTSLLLLGQGVESAGSYWTLLIEYGRNYSAMYGLPIPWDDSLFWTAILLPTVVAGFWAGGIGVAWRRLRAVRRGMAAALVVQFALAAQRGIGRSDAEHLSSLEPLTLVWSMLGLWSILAAARTPSHVRRAAALVGALAALALTLHGTVAPTNWLDGLRRARNDASRLPSPEPALAARLQANDTIWDVQNADAYLAYDRENPTRHALAYCLPSPAEQRMALTALKRRPPRLVFWRHASKHDLAVTDIPNPLRYYAISPWIYRDYRPLQSKGDGLILEPAPPDWDGMDDVDLRLGGPLPLGWLAERWGAERAATLASTKRRSIAFETPMTIRPREWNYLLIEAAADSPITARLGISGADGTWDETSFVSWRMTGDGRTRRYLIPIGCCPGWAWRKLARGLRVVAEQGAVRVQSAELRDVED